MNYIRRAVRRMKGYTPGEQPQGARFVKLNTNENPYPPSPCVRQAIRRAISTLRLYPDPAANRLRLQAARVYGVKTENVLAGNGSDDLLTIVSRAALDRGDPVLIPVPTYSLYETLVTLQEGRLITVPFRPDFTLPAEFFSTTARLVFLASPNSPSGTMISSDQIIRLLRKKNTLVVVDEAYIDFADNGHSSALPLIHDHSNLVVLRTLSKSYSLAGMRIGLAFAHDELIRELFKVKDSYNLDRLSIAAGEAALKDVAWMRRNAERIRRTRRFLAEHLERLGFEVPLSQSNFVLARRPGENLRPLYLALKERRILVRYFDAPFTRDGLRITVGTDNEIRTLLKELRRMV